jgi:hypothetical protein
MSIDPMTSTTVPTPRDALATEAAAPQGSRPVAHWVLMPGTPRQQLTMVWETPKSLPPR